MAFDLATSHAYQRFIDRVMDVVIKDCDSHPLHMSVFDREFPEIAPVRNVDVLTACYRAQTAWRHAHHKRHMLGFYGKRVD